MAKSLRFYSVAPLGRAARGRTSAPSEFGECGIPSGWIPSLKYLVQVQKDLWVVRVPFS